MKSEENHFSVYKPTKADAKLVQDIDSFSAAVNASFGSANWMQDQHGVFGRFYKAEEANMTDPNGWHEGMRRIDEDRFEVRLIALPEGGYHTEEDRTASITFARLAHGAGLGPEFANRLIAHTMQHTTLDEGEGFRHENFSLIISFGRVNAQTPHIDVVPGCYQVALMMSRAEGTLVLPRAGERTLEEPPKTASDLLDLWGIQLAPDTAAFDSAVETINKALQWYGDLLVPFPHIDRAMLSLKNAPAGTVVVTEGGRVHAGPAVYSTFGGGLRMVLFANVSKEGGTTYDKDDQFVALSVMTFLVDKLWPFATTPEHKKGLLRRLYQTVLDYKKCMPRALGIQLLPDQQAVASPDQVSRLQIANHFLRDFVVLAEGHVREKRRKPKTAETFAAEWLDKS